MNYTKVFQTSFDIAHGDGITAQDKEDLCNEIKHLIDNYSGINGKPLNFQCINGLFEFVDMTEDYSSELKEKLYGTQSHGVVTPVTLPYDEDDDLQEYIAQLELVVRAVASEKPFPENTNMADIRREAIKVLSKNGKASS